MSEMIDRVRQAISAKFEGSCSGWTSDEDPPFDVEEIARAAIEALREPTDAMLDAFSGMAMPIGYTKEGWQAAIDEALKP